MNEEVGVRFGASTGQFDAAVSKIKSSLASVGGSATGLQGTLKGLGSSFSGVFTGGGASAIGSVESAMGALAQTAAGVLGKLGPVGLGVAAVASASVGATGILIKLAGSFGNMAEELDRTSQKLNMATADVMRWNAVAKMTGVSEQSMSMSLMRLEKAMESAAKGGKGTAEAFKKLGVDVKSAQTPTETILKIADKFKDMPDGPEKIALAMQTMGRAGSQLIPILNGGSEALAEQFKVAEEYGAVMDDAFIQKGLAVGDAMDRMDIGFDGIANTVYDALAPAMLNAAEGVNEVIKSFIASYKEGGVVKDVMDTVAVTFDVLGQVGSAVFGAIGDIVAAFGDVFEAVFSSISAIFEDTVKGQKEGVGIWEGLFKGFLIVLRSVGTGFRMMGTVVGAVVRGLATTFTGLATILDRVFSLDFAGAVSAFGEWKSKMSALAVEAGEEIVTNGKNAFAEYKAIWEKPIRSTIDTSGPGRTRSGIDLSGVEDQGAGKAAAKAAAEAKKRAQEELALYLETLRGKMDAARGNQTEMMRLEEEKIARIKEFYGEESKEYRAALNEKAAMERQFQQELNSIRREEIAHATQMAQITVDTETDSATSRIEIERGRLAQLAAVGAISRSEELQAMQGLARDEYQLQVQHEKRMYDLEVQALRDRMALKGLEQREIDALNRQIEAAKAQYDARVAKAATKNTQQQLADERALWMENHKVQMTAINSVSQSWGNALARMAVGQATFSETVRAMWQGIVGAIVQAIAGMVAEWIAQQLVMLVFGKAMKAATAGPQVIANSAVAATGAYAAMASIPIIGPALAPAAAATAFAGSMAYYPLTLAEGGYDVPTGVNPLTQLHEQEMVLPKNLANPLRAMLTGPGPNGLAAQASRAGMEARGSAANNNAQQTTTFNYNPSITQGGDRSLDQLLAKEGAAMRRWIGNQVRAGKLKVV